MQKQLPSAVESVAEDAPYEDLPVLSKGELPPEWQSECPVLCVSYRPKLVTAGIGKAAYRGGA